ncbi:hypothetical protein [Thauera sp.]|uniref:hypothetical protein n=1 Tax=Thauera sp. TaxID=1905334 RepID=UPI002D08C84D|nr:hypothetical protein [Thauera sp.]HRP26375.1 hypothetical protein [Thauera sp.]
MNKLTDAEAERLAMLAEEAAEVVQIVGKILRHGYDSYHPLQPDVLNRELLDDELRDLLTVAKRMVGKGDVEGNFFARGSQCGVEAKAPLHAPSGGSPYRRRRPWLT